MLNSDELVCKPLHTYKELLDFVNNPPVWKSMCIDLKTHSEHSIRNCEEKSCFSQVILENALAYCHFDPDLDEAPSRHKRCHLPKTLVCHDMANGYHDDSVIDGTGTYDAYTFYNWAGIDIFCYFSHHLVTIPPLGWINVGHAHGVKVIGTVITEWNNGTTFWDKVLSSEEEMQHCISALVLVAKTLKFDGWLLNVENKISQPQKLLEFVQGLHSSLHEALPDPVLIWYDSVTVDGQLNWQNKLNSQNKDFFEACDGFFTNYSWSATDVLESVAAAGGRLTDLYVGIDVWGRNCFGGGQFNTQEAVKIAHSLGCSLAIFAPAWTHEAMAELDVSATDKSTLTKHQRFMLRDRALWDSLWPFLNTKLPCAMPFKTSFCRGQGLKRRLYGEVVSPVPWYNVRHMQYQPNAAHGPHGYSLVLKQLGDGQSSKGIVLQDSIDIILQEDTARVPVESQEELGLEIKWRDSHTLVRRTESIDRQRPAVSQTSSLRERRSVDETKRQKKTIIDIVRDFFRRKRSSSQKSISSSSSQVSRRSVAIREVMTPLNPIQLTDSNARVGLTRIPHELECIEYYYEDSFTGGSCLKINPSDVATGGHRTIRLFYCDFFCEHTLIFCCVTKHFPGYSHQYLNIHLYAMDNSGNELRVILVGRNTATRSCYHVHVKNEYPCPQTASEFRDLQNYLLLNQPDFYVPTENSFGWNVWYFQVSLPEVQIRSINVKTGELHGPILLGYVGLCQRKS